MLRTLITSTLVTSIVVFSAVPASAQEDRDQARPERFAVTAGEDVVVMVEEISGRTWMLQHSAEEAAGPVWVPIERIDSHDAAHHWREKQLAIAEEREHRERREREERTHREREERELIHRERHRAELEDRLHELERVRGEHLDKLGEDHPEVRELSEQMKRIERELDELNRHERPRKRDDRRAEDFEHRRRELQERAREFRQEALQKHLDQLREHFGEDHPAVRNLEKQLEKTSESGESGTDDRRRDAESEAVTKELIPLLLEEEVLLQTHGPEHPEVRKVRRQIDVARELRGEGRD